MAGPAVSPQVGEVDGEVDGDSSTELERHGGIVGVYGGTQTCCS